MEGGGELPSSVLEGSLSKPTTKGGAFVQSWAVEVGGQVSHPSCSASLRDRAANRREESPCPRSTRERDNAGRKKMRGNEVSVFFLPREYCSGILGMRMCAKRGTQDHDLGESRSVEA